MTTVPGTPAAVERPAAAAVPTAPTGSMAAVTADPAPLGLAAFGITTMALSAINAAWIGAAGRNDGGDLELDEQPVADPEGAEAGEGGGRESVVAAEGPHTGQRLRNPAEG